MNKLTPKSNLTVDQSGFVYVDGVKIAKYVADKRCLQFWDKDHVRSNKRGSRVVEVSLTEVASLENKK